MHDGRAGTDKLAHLRQPCFDDGGVGATQSALADIVLRCSACSSVEFDFGCNDGDVGFLGVECGRGDKIFGSQFVVALELLLFKFQPGLR